MIERPKNETGFESGAGEGDVSGRGWRAAISACLCVRMANKVKHFKRVGSGLKTACRRKTTLGED